MSHVLITGGSEGIGLELAKCFASDGCDLIIAGRDAGKLQDAAAVLENQYHVAVRTIAIDLSEPQAAEELHEAVSDTEISVLINNAGMGTAGKAWQIPAADDERLIAVNITALTVLTKLFLKDMLERNRGVIMNVASTGAFQPGPYIASYYASKAYVLSYTRALAEEVKDTDVQVCCLCPGPVLTGFYRKSQQKEPSAAMPAAECADYAWRMMKKGKTVIIPGPLNRLAALVPEGIAMHFVAGMKKRNLMKKDD